MATRQHPQPPNLSHTPSPTSPTMLGLKQCYWSPLEGSVIEASTGQVITKDSRAETAKYVFWFQSPCLFLLPQTGSSRCDEIWQQPHSLPLESRMSLWQELSNVFGKVVPGNLSSDLRECTYGDQELWQRYVSASIYTFQWSEAEPYFKCTREACRFMELQIILSWKRRIMDNITTTYIPVTCSVSLYPCLPGFLGVKHVCVITSASQVPDSVWHTVVLERYLWNGWMRTTGLTTKLCSSHVNTLMEKVFVPTWWQNNQSTRRQSFPLQVVLKNLA